MGESRPGAQHQHKHSTGTSQTLDTQESIRRTRRSSTLRSGLTRTEKIGNRASESRGRDGESMGRWPEWIDRLAATTHPAAPPSRSRAGSCSPLPVYLFAPPGANEITCIVVPVGSARLPLAPILASDMRREKSVGTCDEWNGTAICIRANTGRNA